jgi:hypothetical protein
MSKIDRQPIKISAAQAVRVAHYSPLFDSEAWRRFCASVNEPRQQQRPDA